MRLIPAIDLRDGRCVRLLKGDYDQETVYHDDPVAQARAVREAGLNALHIVDLDAAREGNPKQRELIARMVDESGLQVQVGGGLRDLPTIEHYLETLGCAKVVIGTAAIKNPGLVSDAVKAFGAGRIIVALDLRDGNVAVAGWKEGTTRSGRDALASLIDRGVTTFLITDIGRDGTLEGPNIPLYADLLAFREDAQLIASGGVSGLGDLESLKAQGMYAAVIGRAIYEQKISLAEIAGLAHTWDEEA